MTPHPSSDAAAAPREASPGSGPPPNPWLSAQRFALAAAMVLALAWLVWPTPDRGDSFTPVDEEALAPTVWETWDLEPTDWPGSVDGAPWRPLAFLDDGAALGTDDSGRLLYLEPGDEPDVTVLAEPGGAPGIAAVAATDDRLAWIESVPDAEGRVVSGLWTAERGPDGRPGEAERLTGDTGDVIASGSTYDLQFASEALHWLSTAPGDEPITEHRSIPVEGGEVEVVGHVGSWHAAAWPWLASAGSESVGRSQMVRTDNGSGLTLQADPEELALCSATWCRLVKTDPDGSRIDLIRPDGTERVTVAEGFASAVSQDVGLIDRFEPLEETSGETGDGTRLLLFDLGESVTYLVDSQTSNAGADDRHLWWSTGTGELRNWHVLDLTDLA
ncbi:hypothetical protein [Glycomyces salinus]|uniref:hypothetical protein n=1 Tax=Glycomyces salinus TaxID=980294 RepID=UPI0018ECF1F8|nr:hypothetical protein [Glycomyces salinus]